MAENLNLKTIDTVDTRPFKKLVMTIGELPTSFVESMTYYELLAWFVNYLETVIIPTVNNNAEAVEELQRLFIKLKGDTEDEINRFEEYITDLYDELKDFVDNYFENLDVQDEINNKLDQMAQDGTLEEIISIYLNSRAIFGYDTVADMKAATNLVDGSFAKTMGYYNVDDNGSGLYKIRTLEAGETTDEMLLIALDSGLVAQLITNNTINTAQCGIKGDGITNETTKLNTFFALDPSLNKIVTEGVYLIDNTVYIGGIWRQDTGNNGQKSIIFERATIKYNGTSGGYSIILYSMFKYKIKGLCVARDSVENKVGVIGVWFGDFANFDIQNLEYTNDATILDGRTTPSNGVEYVNFSNGYIKGTFYVKPVNFINSNNFYNTIFEGRNHDYCIMLYGNSSKQELNFYNCDLSYATTAIFYVDEEQTTIAKGNINCIGCYFDSNVPIFAGHNKNNMEFNSLFCIYPAMSNNEIVNVKFTDFFKNLNLGGYGQFGHNLPFSNVNYCVNGDLSWQTNQSGNPSYLMGTNSAVWTKTYEDNTLSINGKARHLKWLGSSANASIIAESVTAPRTDTYSCYARLKITAGSCSGVQLSFNGLYVTYDSSILDGECLVVNSKNVKVNENGSLNFSIIFIDASSDLEVDIYEVGVTEGKLITPNMPLDSRAKITA